MTTAAAPSIADAMLDLITTRLGPHAAPRLSAIHLPPVPWNGSKDGEFAAVELDGGALGLSDVLLVATLATLAGVDGSRCSTVASPRWVAPGLRTLRASSRR